jgi:hypothetical protein
VCCFNLFFRNSLRNAIVWGCFVSTVSASNLYSAATTRQPTSSVWPLDDVRVRERAVHYSGLSALRVAGTLTKTVIWLVVSA